MVFMLLLIVNLQRKHACVIGSSSAISKQQFLLVCKVLLDCMPYRVLAWLYLMILPWLSLVYVVQLTGYTQ